MKEELVAVLPVFFMIILFISTMLGIKEYEHICKIVDRDTKVKCYDQTHDNQCWGIR